MPGSSTKSKSSRKAKADAPAEARAAPLHNLQIEQAVLGCILIEGGLETLPRCIEAKLQAESFHEPRHQHIYQAMLELNQKSRNIDELLLADQLESQNLLESIGAHTYINELSSQIETTTHLPHYLNTLKELQVLRQLVKLTESANIEARSRPENIANFIEAIETQIYQLSEDRISESATILSPSIDRVVEHIALLKQNKGGITGMHTGFADLDRLTMGWHSGEMIVVAARPSMGKTALALNAIEPLICPPDGREATPTLMFSLEMPADQLALRLLCSRARINLQKIRDGFNIGAQELNNAAKELKQAPLYIDDSAGLTISELRAKARRMANRLSGKLGLIVVDYLQLLSGADPRVPREQQISEISRGLKACAKELKMPILVMAQLNRESEKEKRQPRMSDLRESGSIEQDADVILLIARDRETSQEDELNEDILKRHLIIAKQRNGPVGIVPLNFIRSLTRFESTASHRVAHQD